MNGWTEYSQTKVTIFMKSDFSNFLLQVIIIPVLIVIVTLIKALSQLSEQHCGSLFKTFPCVAYNTF